MKYKIVDLDKIIIPTSFAGSVPNPFKLRSVERAIREGTFEALKKELVISRNHVLMDGYVTYLALKNCGCKSYNRVIISPCEMNRNDGACNGSAKMLFVYAKHSLDSDREFVWKVAAKSNTARLIDIGSEIIVDTIRGRQTAYVTRMSDTPPDVTQRYRYVRYVVKR